MPPQQSVNLSADLRQENALQCPFTGSPVAIRNQLRRGTRTTENGSSARPCSVTPLHQFFLFTVMEQPALNMLCLLHSKNR